LESYFPLSLTARFPYPKVAVAELNPPLHAGTSWNFDNIRPQLEAFMNATLGKGKQVRVAGVCCAISVFFLLLLVCFLRCFVSSFSSHTLGDS
jgi:hypothetical protein